MGGDRSGCPAVRGIDPERARREVRCVSSRGMRNHSSAGEARGAGREVRPARGSRRHHGAGRLRPRDGVRGHEFLEPEPGAQAWRTGVGSRPQADRQWGDHERGASGVPGDPEFVSRGCTGNRARLPEA